MAGPLQSMILGIARQNCFRIFLKAISSDLFPGHELSPELPGQNQSSLLGCLNFPGHRRKYQYSLNTVHI